MHITAITQHGVAGWPTLKWGQLTPGLNALYGPPRSGKTTTVGLLSQTLFGKAAQCEAFNSPIDAPPGEVFVESDLGQYRVRRYRDEQGFTRLTVAGFNGAAVDAATMRRLVGSLSPTVLGPLCAISFRQPPDVATLLSAEFARGFEIIERGSPLPASRRTAELTARRDQLAQELETRLAGERQVSKDLELRCRELDRLIRTAQEKVAAIEQSMQATETTLAETDARLRYRRLEINVGLQGTRTVPAPSAVPEETSQQVLRLRAMLAELAQWEASVRAQRAQLHSSQPHGDASMRTTRDWLTVGRQLSADLAGETARLARATASQQCVCRDAHPRLRPISETIERQLDVLGRLVEEHESALEAARLDAEIRHLADSQVALQRQVDHLLERNHSGRQYSTLSDHVASHSKTFSAADAEQLESRRLELEQQRFHLADELRAHGRALRDLRAQRETVERQRASLLSARSIEHVQRELAGVQQKLELAASLCGDLNGPAIANDAPARASDFLAQLTDGGLVRLTLVEQGRRACVVNRAGQTLRVESLTAAERDLVYISLCLALLSEARRQGVRLPLLLDDPFERLDARSTAALAAVLGDFSRQGHQVVVVTGQQWAAERVASVGALVQSITQLQQRQREITPLEQSYLPESQAPTQSRASTKPTPIRRKRALRKRPKTHRLDQPAEESAPTDHSDAA